MNTSTPVWAAILVALLFTSEARAVNIYQTLSDTSAYAERGTLTPGIIFESDSQNDSDAAQGIGPASAESVALAGSLLGQGARGNGRAIGGDIAANANFADQFGTYERYTAYSEATSVINAVYEGIVIFPFSYPEQITLDFFLPPAEMEIVDFVERPASTPILAGISISLEVILNEFGTPEHRSVVDFQASLETSVDQGGLPVLANQMIPEIAPPMMEPPAFDLATDPAYAPVRTDITSADGLTLTTNVVFPAFTGSYSLPPRSIGTDLQVRYTLAAYVSGPAAMTSAFAAVNDPFGLSGSVPSPFTVTGSNTPAAVPAPPALVLLGSVIAAAAVIRRRRPR